jgi:hypothetical protein
MKNRVVRDLTLGLVDLDARAARRAAREEFARRASVPTGITAMLPSFLLTSPTPIGSRWTTIAALSCGRDERVDGTIFDIDPSAHPASVAVVLPRGTNLRLVDTFLENWGALPVGISYDLLVEDGSLAGRTFEVPDLVCDGWFSRPRPTLAVALIVPADDPAATDEGAARAHYAAVIARLRAFSLSQSPKLSLPDDDAPPWGDPPVIDARVPRVAPRLCGEGTIPPAR